MRLLHSATDTSAQFDDPNLVSCAGLVPVMRLAQDCDLAGLVAEPGPRRCRLMPYL